MLERKKTVKPNSTLKVNPAEGDSFTITKMRREH